MANTNDSPNNGHDINDEDYPEVLKIIEQFDKSLPEKQKEFIKRLRSLATQHYVSSPNLAEVCEQVAKDFERRISNLPSADNSTDDDKQG